MTDKAWKMLGFCLACGSAVVLGTADVQAAKPEPSFTSGTSIAGFGTAMDKHLESVEETESQAVSAGLTQEKVVFGTFRDIFKNLGVAMVEDSLNIRKEPKNDADIVGKMDSHAGCSVLGMEHGWYKIKSGQVTGYVSGKYLAVGQAARASAYYDMKLMLRVNTDTLRVRSAPDTDSEILGRIHEGETYDFLSRAGGGWIKIRYGEKDGYAYVPGNAVVAYTPCVSSAIHTGGAEQTRIREPTAQVSCSMSWNMPPAFIWTEPPGNSPRRDWRFLPRPCSRVIYCFMPAEARSIMSPCISEAERSSMRPTGEAALRFQPGITGSR